MIVHDHSVLADRSDFFTVSVTSLSTHVSATDDTVQIFFGLAKGFGALTDITATAAMCLSLENSRSQMVGSVRYASMPSLADTRRATERRTQRSRTSFTTSFVVACL